MEKNFDIHSGVTAVVCANDHMALGVLHWLQSHQISVPSQMSVLGFDGLPGAASYSPPLTTVAVETRAFGSHIMQRLIRGTGGKARVVPSGGAPIGGET